MPLFLIGLLLDPLLDDTPWEDDEDDEDGTAPSNST
jgi:hypothetical protein